MSHLTVSNILPRVARYCQKKRLLTSNDTIVVGVSGGADSLCLLHVLATLSSELDLTLIVAHLNHQLRGPDSEADADFVKKSGQQLKLPVIEESHNVAELAAQRKQSLEEAARQVRYAFLWRVAQQNGAAKIAVGHNSDDQVETILMHFLRGTGLAGLRGMLPGIDVSTLTLHADDVPDSTTDAPLLIRPLLEIPRAEIDAYCKAHNLVPRHDYSNLDTTFYRNRLRHELIPHLESYNPNIKQVLQRTAKVIAAEAKIVTSHLDEAWPQVVKNVQSEFVEFHRQAWLKLPLALKRSTLRRAVSLLRHNLRDIGFEHIENAIWILEDGGTGARITLPHELVIAVEYQYFTMASKAASDILQNLNGPQLKAKQVIRINIPGTTPLPGADWQVNTTLLESGRINLDKIQSASGWEAYLDGDVVGNDAILRPRQPGDTFVPLGMAGHKKINEFMIDQKIPAAWRNHLPLLVSKEQVMWVCGYRPDDRAKVGHSTERVLHIKFVQKS